jgi:hypothetical protein
MSVAPSALTTLCCEKTLVWLSEIKKQLTAFGVQNLRSNRNSYNYVLAILTVPVRTFAVFAAFSFVLRVVTQVEQCIQSLIGFEPNVTAAPAVAARRPAARHKFFTPKSRDAIAAVTGLDLYFCTIDKHK